ncbi:CTB family bacteriocin [Cuspidothrix issatschenkoi LEGE 03284]|uniref:CTB family bacteriocin n=1 Tax=Cuspidothrix issatschenkoi TaxID=230752 RepID=UPI00187FBE91|nr:CTB family bacteriocin [Cuspidothrix issatschenkoi]MBE9233521.1 CTB family bacteriocin [Cuspidothrix issatschenkoi LEGE 03284]
MSNLFTAVSVEQQEIVAGGILVAAPTFVAIAPTAGQQISLFATYFKGKKTVQSGGSNSGWKGSNADGSQNITDVTSAGLSFLQA